MAVDVAALSKTILSQAAQTAGETWVMMKEAARAYVRGYAENLALIAKHLAMGNITPGKAKTMERNARLLLVMAINEATQIGLVQVQKIVNQTLAAVKGAVNAAIGFAIL